MTLEGSNRYCGPAALAAIFGSGMTTDQAARLIRQRSGQSAVKGASYGAVRGVIAGHGGTYVSRSALVGSAVWQIAKGRALTLLVVATEGHFDGHYVVVRRGKVIDSYSRTWVPVSRHRWRNARILSAIEITSLPRMVKPNKPKPRPKDTPARRQRLARIEAARSALRLTMQMKNSHRDLATFLPQVESTLAILRRAGRTRAQFAEAMRAARDQRLAIRQLQRQAQADAVLVVKAGPRIIEEIEASEMGRHEDAGCPDRGDVVAAIHRSPPGMICFLCVDEVRDACWALNTGTAFLNDNTHLRFRVDDIVATLDGWLNTFSRKVGAGA